MASYTAAQIAIALGKPPRIVRRELAGIAPAKTTEIRGQTARLWTIDQLPIEHRQQLDLIASGRGYRSADALLGNPDLRWDPPVPIAKIDRAWHRKAEQLQKALSRPLLHLNDLSLCSSEFVKMGIEDYRREIGQISEKQWHRVLQMVLDRDGGRHEWHRIALYFDGRALRTQRDCNSVAEPEKLDAFELLCLIENGLENRAKPTARDREKLFDTALRTINEADRRGVIEEVVRILMGAVPAFSKNRRALRRQLERKAKQWKDEGGNPTSVDDGRRKRQSKLEEEFSEDIKTLRDLARKHSGHISLAFRLAHTRGRLSPEFSRRYPLDIRRKKSYVPAAVRRAVNPVVVQALIDLERGPKHARSVGPYVHRVWSGVPPGDFFSADDVTLNHPCWQARPDCDPPYWTGRAEHLISEDLRTGYHLAVRQKLGNGTAGKPSYNSVDVAKLWGETFRKVGIPRRGILAEQGIWKAAWATQGIGQTNQHWARVLRELRKRGLEVSTLTDLEMRHARIHRAKLIEHRFHHLQDRMASIPGFVGFNERLQKRERMDEFMTRVRQGKEHPGNELLEAGEMLRALEEIFRELDQEPQNGKLLNGISPEEAWCETLDSRPLEKLPDDLAPFLGSHIDIYKVRWEGIKINVPGAPEPYLYHSDRTGDLIGKEVLIVLDPDHPEMLVASELGTEEWFVARSSLIPAMDASSEEFAEARRRHRAHTGPVKAMFAEMKHTKAASVTRDNLYTPESKTLGRFVGEETIRSQEEAKSSENSRRREKERLRRRMHEIEQRILQKKEAATES